MQGISFKQYLILRKLHKSQPEKVQLDPDSQDFIYLIDSKLIESEQNFINPEIPNVIGFFSENNGLSSVTSKGSDLYHSYFDKYLNRTGIITSFILSVIAIIISIAALYKAQ